MKKIAIVAGPSMGKTVTALLLGVRLKMLGKEVHFVLEYATNYIIRNGAPRNVFEQLAIFCGQTDEEGYVEKTQTGDYLICDSASFLAAVYARHYRPAGQAGKPGPGADKEEVRKYNYVLKTIDKWVRERALSSYDFIFFLPAELEFRKNSVRWQSDIGEVKRISDEIESYLIIEGAKYHRISGSLEERVEQIIKILEEVEEKEKNFQIFPIFE